MFITTKNAAQELVDKKLGDLKDSQYKCPKCGKGSSSRRCKHCDLLI